MCHESTWWKHVSMYRLRGLRLELKGLIGSLVRYKATNTKRKHVTYSKLGSNGLQRTIRAPFFFFVKQLRQAT